MQRRLHGGGPLRRRKAPPPSNPRSMVPLPTSFARREELNVRIIAGQFRGRPLQAPPGLATRPTADRVREALFSMLVSRIGSLEGLRVADLYAGSGALGLEAISRGAEHATFVETDPKAQAAIKANAAKLGVIDNVRILGGSALALPRSEPFDLILADPPYSTGSGSAVVKAVADSGWLAPGGWMSVETARADTVDPADCTVDAERELGRARITLLRRP
jgi:16S rRNA (guanine966-N2)-methyltransferase